MTNRRIPYHDIGFEDDVMINRREDLRSESQSAEAALNNSRSDEDDPLLDKFERDDIAEAAMLESREAREERRIRDEEDQEEFDEVLARSEKMRAEGVELRDSYNCVEPRLEDYTFGDDVDHHHSSYCQCSECHPADCWCMGYRDLARDEDDSDFCCVDCHEHGHGDPLDTDEPDWDNDSYWAQAEEMDSYDERLAEALRRKSGWRDRDPDAIGDLAELIGDHLLNRFAPRIKTRGFLPPTSMRRFIVQHHLKHEYPRGSGRNKSRGQRVREARSRRNKRPWRDTSRQRHAEA